MTQGQYRLPAVECLSHLTVLENVMLAPRKVLCLSGEQAEEIASSQLIHFGLAEKLKVYPNLMSESSEYMLFDEVTSADLRYA